VASAERLLACEEEKRSNTGTRGLISLFDLISDTKYNRTAEISGLALLRHHRWTHDPFPGDRQRALMAVRKTNSRISPWLWLRD
jgi:hypothetical protein